MIRVLVVDDDYHVAHAHALSVARVPGFEVVGEAHTGAEARELVTEGEVRVNGEVDTRRGRQLHRGGVVSVDHPQGTESATVA
jgi:ribosome-associated protein